GLVQRRYRGLMPATTPSGPQILLVDDDAAITNLLQRLLTAEGYRVSVAADGVEALRIVGTLRPDLILLDVDLPRLNGDEICRRLKSDPATHLIPIVMVTAQGAFQNR